LHFATLQFAYFFLPVLTGAWLLRSKATPHKVLLLLASYFFYGRFSFWLIGLLIASSLVNYYLGEVITRSKTGARKKAALWAGLVSNLGLLILFKYYGFFAQTVTQAADFLGLQAHLPVLQLALPLGISFFTFQGLAYVIDIYRGRGVLASSVLDFLLFIAFFPKLLAGPICRSKDLLPQIAEGPPAGIPELPRAVALICSGLFKKMVIATILSVRMVDNAFQAPENFTGWALWVAAYGYSIQLYCDFSGYTDMARGLALLLGYRLPENFNGPYAATDLGLFWKRWHATFSSWLREYVYFPLGGSRGSLGRTCLNLIITFIVCGLWHGASWGYIVWGALHGLFLSGHKIVRQTRRKFGLMGKEPRWYLFAGWFMTFHLVVVSRIVFRAGDIETAGQFFLRMVSFTPHGMTADTWVLLACLLGFSLNFYGRRVRSEFIRIHGLVPQRWVPVVWVAIAVVLLALKPGDVAPYIYFQF
jgi:alginate O-acetyltransferase complex protein AlgI